MLVTLFLTRYLMPVLYSFFPAPAGNAACEKELVQGSHYTDRFLKAAPPSGHASSNIDDGNMDVRLPNVQDDIGEPDR
jgi:cobalt-zinc-cadmium resistance protein CzcA